jgi:hypothetical protein
MGLRAQDRGMRMGYWRSCSRTGTYPLMKELSDRADEGKYRPAPIITSAPKSGKLAEEILSLYTELNDGI